MGDGGCLYVGGGGGGGGESGKIDTDEAIVEMYH